MNFRNSLHVDTIDKVFDNAILAHGLHLSKAGHRIRMGLHIIRLLFKAIRRHDIVRRKSAEIFSAGQFKHLVQGRNNALIFAMNVAELEFGRKLLQNLGRRILATIVENDEFKRDALLFHHGTNGRFHIFFVIVAGQKHRNHRREFALFGFFALRKRFHVNIFRHFLRKHVGYGVFHLSLHTKI